MAAAVFPQQKEQGNWGEGVDVHTLVLGAEAAECDHVEADGRGGRWKTEGSGGVVAGPLGGFGGAFHIGIWDGG